MPLPRRSAAARPVSASRTELVEFVLPQDANALGTALGGRVMHFVDMAGAIAALRHCHAPVVTASIDHVDFRSPIQVGELMILKSSVNRTFHTSLEVGVKVFSENPLTGRAPPHDQRLSHVRGAGRGAPPEGGASGRLRNGRRSPPLRPGPRAPQSPPGPSQPVALSW